MSILDIFKSTPASAPEAPSAIELLTKDHDEVRALFKEVRQAGDRAYKEKQRLFDEIDRALSVHTTIEEEIFYPAVQASRAEGREKLVLEAREEHTVVKRLLAELERLEPSDETFDAKMQVLMEEVEHHADEEEDEMFPAVRKAFGSDRLHELGGRMERRKQRLLRGPARRAASAARTPVSRPTRRKGSKASASPRSAARASRKAASPRSRAGKKTNRRSSAR